MHSPSWIAIANILVRDRERHEGDEVPPIRTIDPLCMSSWSLRAMVRRCAALVRPRKGGDTNVSLATFTEKHTHDGPDSSLLRKQDGSVKSGNL